MLKLTSQFNEKSDHTKNKNHTFLRIKISLEKYIKTFQSM